MPSYVDNSLSCNYSNHLNTHHIKFALSLNNFIMKKLSIVLVLSQCFNKLCFSVFSNLLSTLFVKHTHTLSTCTHQVCNIVENSKGLYRYTVLVATFFVYILSTGVVNAQTGTSTCWIVSEDDDYLQTIDRFTGVISNIGDMDSDHTDVEAVAYNTDNNVLYAIDKDDFGVLNLSNGEWINIGTIGGYSDWEGLTYNRCDHKMYACVDDDDPAIAEINLTTGSYVSGAFGGNNFLMVTGLGSYDSFNDIAFDPTTGVMYAIAEGSSDCKLVTIDLNNGTASIIGYINENGSGMDMDGLSFSDDGMLYGTEGDDFWSIDKNSGNSVELYSLMERIRQANEAVKQ